MEISSSLQSSVSRSGRNEQISGIEFLQTPYSEQTQPNFQQAKIAKQQRISTLINNIKTQLQTFTPQNKNNNKNSICKQKQRQLKNQNQIQALTQTPLPKFHTCYQSLTQKFSQLIHCQTPYNLKLSQIMRTIVEKWRQFPQHGCFLEFFDYCIMAVNGAIKREDYTEFIYIISQTIMQYTLKYHTQNNNKLQDKNQLIQNWHLYFDLLRSYTYHIQEYSKTGTLPDDNWFYYGIYIGLLLSDCQIDTRIEIDGVLHKVKYQKLLDLAKKLLQSRVFLTIYHKFFHPLCMYLRIYLTIMPQFLQKPNLVLRPTQKYKQVNNCQLLLRFLQKQFTNLQYTQTSQNKLDCLCLLMTLVSGQLPKSGNYNQVLEFGVFAALFFLEEEMNKQRERLEKKSMRKDKNQFKDCISQVSFYCGQLISIILHKNLHFLLQFCRKPENKSQKYLKKVLKLYQKTLNKIKTNLPKMQEQQYVYTRIILGFCALIRIQNMEDYVDKTVKEFFPTFVRIIQGQYGWEQEQGEESKEQYIEEQDVQEFQKQFSSINFSSQEKKQQVQQNVQFQQIPQLNQYKQNVSKEPQITSMNFTHPSITKEEQENSVIWSQQFYHKNKLSIFQELDQIQIFKKSMLVAQKNNPQLFQFLMHNFSQKQMMMWVVELQKEDEKNSDQDWDDDIREEKSSKQIRDERKRQQSWVCQIQQV